MTLDFERFAESAFPSHVQTVCDANLILIWRIERGNLPAGPTKTPTQSLGFSIAAGHCTGRATQNARNPWPVSHDGRR